MTSFNGSSQYLGGKRNRKKEFAKAENFNVRNILKGATYQRFQDKFVVLEVFLTPVNLLKIIIMKLIIMILKIWITFKT